MSDRSPFQSVNDAGRRERESLLRDSPPSTSSYRSAGIALLCVTGLWLLIVGAWSVALGRDNQAKLASFESRFDPGTNLPTSALSILADLKIFTFSLYEDYASVRQVIPAAVTFTDSITGHQVPISMGTRVFTLAGVTNPTPFPTGGNVTSFPSILQPKGISDGFLTVMMIDPDSRDPVTHQQQILHWWVANIPAVGEEQPLPIAMGDALYGWMKPGPPVNSGDHRYTILVYHQTVRINPARFPVFVPGTDVNGRPLSPNIANTRYYRFPQRAMASVYGLVPKLVAMNFMHVFNEDPTQKNYPLDPVVGTPVFTVGGGLTDILITKIGSGYLRSPPAISISGCTGAVAVFNVSTALSAAGTLNMPQPLPMPPGLQTQPVSIREFLSDFQPGQNCVAGATVTFSLPPTVVAS